ncbi:MAG: transcription factor [candidate division BRC1 bacterium ADurb.BinA364]|nr:MAG: transcription factor [candidate division BRC1 bacterium ADurb.BinA364]
MTLATAAAVATLPAPLLTPRNVVCVTRITDALDLPALAAAIDGADYNPKTFPGMIVRMSNPRAAALVFNSGKLVLTGLPHPDAIPAAFAAVLEDLRTAGAALDLDTLRTRADQALIFRRISPLSSGQRQDRSDAGRPMQPTTDERPDRRVTSVLVRG